ncbi:MAG: serine/threonine protein kinase, partial [Cyanobacteria bacterium]|nr:serine/threonine protein kinase [Cyanobacteriota bacterium]
MTDEKLNSALREEELKILETSDITSDGTIPSTVESSQEHKTEAVFNSNEPVEPIIGASETSSVVIGKSMDANKTASENQQKLVDLGGRYEVIDLIGSGASGRVFKAHDKDLDQMLAVKVLKRELLSDAQTVKRFEQEAVSASSLSHENIVAVYGHGTAQDGSPYITMRYIDGESLAKRLSERGPIQWRKAVKLFIQICAGLESAHSAGIIHRDLKPSNIIIESEDGNDHPLILDFGIAKVVSAGVDTFNTLTANGQFLGTPTYMSPEQCLGEAVDSKSDIYALGCMLYEVVAGESPFARANPVELIAKKIGDEVIIPAHDKIDNRLMAVISCAMERNPKERY